jgi:protein involved in polysaccharide export with SLBB domain
VLPSALAAFAVATVAPSLATTIHPGDTLAVKVWNHPDLSKQVTVDANGTVRVPLSGAVVVAGLDEEAAGKKLAQSLRSYVVYPAVDVETIAQGTALFVAGGPGGELKYQPGETLSTAVADALQTTPQSGQTLNDSGQVLTKVDDPSATIRARIDLHRVGIQRDGASIGSYDMVALGRTGEAGPLLQPGDTVVFPDKPIDVRVMGAVAHPGATYLSPDQSMSEAITQAGGLLPTSVSNHVLLQRDGAERSLALGDPAFSEPAHPGDVITVPQAPRVNVIGDVTTPGVVTLKTDSTLLSAMYTAGGPTKYADLHDVKIVRGNEKVAYDVTKLTHGDMSQNPPLQDGDTVVVPEGHYFDFTGVFSVLGGIAAGLATHLAF